MNILKTKITLAWRVVVEIRALEPLRAEAQSASLERWRKDLAECLGGQIKHDDRRDNSQSTNEEDNWICVFNSIAFA